MNEETKTQIIIQAGADASVKIHEAHRILAKAEKETGHKFDYQIMPQANKCACCNCECRNDCFKKIKIQLSKKAKDRLHEILMNESTDALADKKVVRELLKMYKKIEVKMEKATNKQTHRTGGIGYLTSTYQDIIDKLGKPHDRRQDGKWESLDRKVKVEWAFKLDKDTIFTIYDYKSKLEPEENTDWHIGGQGDKAKIKKYLIAEFGRENVEIKTK